MILVFKIKQKGIMSKQKSSNPWYLLQFKPNAHRLAERNLQRQGFLTFLPMRDVTKRKAISFVNQLYPLFPGYMFVSFDPNEALWHKINSTFGVSKLVSLIKQLRVLKI